MAEQGKKTEYYSELEIMDRKERAEELNRGLQQQVQYAYENAPAMKAKFDKAGVKPSNIRTVKDLEKLPVTRKDDIIDMRRENPPFGGLIAVPIEKLERVYMSPGPIYDVETLDDNFFRRGEEMFYAAGFRKGDVAAVSWAYHLVPLGHWLDKTLRRMGIPVIPLGTGNTELQVQVLRDMKVTGWTGSTSFLRKTGN